MLAILVEGGRRAPARHDVAMQIIEQLIFVYQVIKRFALLLFLTALLFAEEDFAERHEHDDADGDDDDAHREEAEEGKRLITALGQYFIDDQVGRRTDEGEHSAQTSGKGERHEETRRLHARARSYAHDDRHHRATVPVLLTKAPINEVTSITSRKVMVSLPRESAMSLLPVSLASPVCMMAPPTTKSPIIMMTMGEEKPARASAGVRIPRTRECCQGGKSHDVGPHPAPYKHGNRND